MAAECPSCGIIFSKWRELREKKKAEDAAAAAALKPEPARPPNLWIGRTISGALAVAWTVGLALYYRHWLAHTRP